MEYDMYTFVLGIILISGYFTFRFINHFIRGYYRERKHLDKILEYGLIGSLGFLLIYFPLKLHSLIRDYPIDIIDANIILFSPFFIVASLIVGCIYQILYGYKKREKIGSLYEKYHMKNYDKGWIIVHLKNGKTFYGRLVLTDVDYESERFVFSIDSVQRLNEAYKIVEEYEQKRELVFNIQDVILLEYIKEKRN